MIGSVHHSISGVDSSDHWIKHSRTRSPGFLPREGCRSCLGTDNKRHLWRCGEGEAGL
jgi:hypothetical protein